MPHAVLALLFALQPLSPVVETSVDIIEVNHLYGEDGKHSFDQIIFWDWCDTACRFHVVGWRMWKRGVLATSRAGGWSFDWLDNDTMRSVRASNYRESWTQFDPEIAERDVLPVNERRELGAKP